MRRAVPFLIALVAAARTAAAQPQAAPVSGEAARGSALFQLRCADCHGVDAKGVHGPEILDYIAVCVSEARLSCLKQAVAQKVHGPERRDFMNRCLLGL